MVQSSKGALLRLAVQKGSRRFEEVQKGSRQFRNGSKHVPGRYTREASLPKQFWRIAKGLKGLPRSIPKGFTGVPKVPDF